MRNITGCIIATALAATFLSPVNASAQDNASPVQPQFVPVDPSPFEDLQRRKWGHPVIADLDQDGYRDILVIDHGWAVKVYWNNAGTYSDPYDVIVGDIHGIAVADYDNDGLLEAAVSRGGGSGSNPRNTKIFRFGRDRSITDLEQLDPPLRGMRGRTHKWFDGDQDGDLDLLQFGFPQMPRRDEGEHDVLRNDGQGGLILETMLPPSDNDNELTLLTDTNGDGDHDIIRYGSRHLELHLGGEGLSFSDVSDRTLPGQFAHATSVVEFDYDNDGDMDLYVARGRLPGNFETFYDPETLRLGFYVKRGTYELPLLELGHTLELRSYQAQYPDHKIWVAEGPYEWERMRDGRDWHAAVNITIPSSEALGFPDERTERGLHFGYVGNEQWRLVFDTFPPVSGVIEGVPSFTESEHVEELPDILLRNDGGTFTDVTREAGLFRRSHSMGVAAGDWNNDGLVDLFVTNRGTPIRGQSHSIWMNNGNGNFEEMTEAPITTEEIGSWGWSAEALDFDNDGRLDILLSNERGLWHLRRNTTEQASSNNWLTVIIGSAPETGTSAMGALVTLTGCGRQQIRRVGSSGAPYSQSFDTNLHFGIGACAEEHRVTVQWPNGESANYLAQPGRFIATYSEH